MIEKIFSNIIKNDAPEPWGTFFQDNATPQIEGLEELHNNIMFYLAIILFAVSWMMVSIIINFKNKKISNKYVNHGTLVELIWTISPALILILIALPSFKLLYLMDEIIDPGLVIFGEGHQWYWSYQYPDFIDTDTNYMSSDKIKVTDLLNPGTDAEASNHNNENYYDTDRLADTLQNCLNYHNVKRSARVRDADVYFSHSSEGMSRIARYVKKNHPGIFHDTRPATTFITDSLISNIKGLRENVPAEFK